MVDQCRLLCRNEVRLGTTFSSVSDQWSRVVDKQYQPINSDKQRGVFVGFRSFVIGTGAAISGCIFTAIELNELEAKQRIEPFKRRSGSGN